MREKKLAHLKISYYFLNYSMQVSKIQKAQVE